MTNKERLEKSKQEHCSKCKNKDKELRDIRVFVADKIIYTRCSFYEREDHKEIRKMRLVKWPNAKKQKPVMKGIDK